MSGSDKPQSCPSVTMIDAYQPSTAEYPDMSAEDAAIAHVTARCSSEAISRGIRVNVALGDENRVMVVNSTVEIHARYESESDS